MKAECLYDYPFVICGNREGTKFYVIIEFDSKIHGDKRLKIPLDGGIIQTINKNGEWVDDNLSGIEYFAKQKGLI